MAPRKPRTGRKGAARNAATEPKSRARGSATRARIGPNKPALEPEVPKEKPDISASHTSDPTPPQIQQQLAERLAHFKAAAPTFLATGLKHLHGAMRERIAGLEETIASLPSSPFDNEIATIKNDLAKLKALPAVPDPQLAQQLEGKLRNLATKILTSDPARLPTTKAIDHFWEKFGGSLMAAAEAIRRLA